METKWDKFKLIQFKLQLGFKSTQSNGIKTFSSIQDIEAKGNKNNNELLSIIGSCRNSSNN